MAIEIMPFRQEDARAIVEMTMAAFATDVFYQSGLPKNMTPEQDEEFIEWRTKLVQDRSRGPNRHYFQAVDTTSGRIVGFAGWHGPLPEGHAAANPGTRYPDAPEWLDKKHWEYMAEMFKKTRREVMGDRGDYWFLQSISVHPDYQGRGIASQLMADALEKLVGPEGADCYIESSPAARRLYQKHGFDTRLEVPQPGCDWVLAAMVRPGRMQTNDS